MIWNRTTKKQTFRLEEKVMRNEMIWSFENRNEII
jgi:hypothetical protein